MRVVAHGGDPYLGGDDVDRALANYRRRRVLRKHGWDLRSDADVFTRLVLDAERAKVQLVHASSSAIELDVDRSRRAAAATRPGRARSQDAVRDQRRR